MPTEKSNIPQLVEHPFESKNIMQRAEDGYFSATEMCKVAGKKIGHYRSIAQTKNFIKSLSKKTGISPDDLMQVNQGGSKGKQGTWVHPFIALNLAQWLSADFSVAVSSIVYDWMENKGKTKDTTPLIEDKKEKHYWLTLNSTGTMQSQVELPDAHAVSEKLNKIFPDFIVLERDKIISDLDQVLYELMASQNKIRMTLEPLTLALGTKEGKTAKEFLQERMDLAVQRLQEAVA